MATDPLRNFKFKVSIPGITSGEMGFSKVTGLNTTVEVIEYREGGDIITPRKFSGQVSYDNVTLERGFTSDSMLIKWVNATFDRSSLADANLVGQQKQDVTITVMQKNSVSARQFVLKNAFVAARNIGDLDASANDIIIESLEIAHEGIIETAYDANGATVSQT